MEYYDQVIAAAEYVRSKIGSTQAQIAITLGTGLGGIQEEVDVITSIDYSDIPHFPTSTVQGHDGKLIIGHWHGVAIIMLAGRMHYYEGYTPKEIVFPIYVLKQLGIKQLWISNVTGGLQAEQQAGDLVLITDHINMMGINPLIGKNDERLGIRFPDMKEAYSHRLNELFTSAAKEINQSYHKGVYVGLHGPSLETPAEYNMLHILGADVVGMSTVPEVIAAKHAELEIMVCSVISNVCYPPERITVTTLEEVIEVANKGGANLKSVWSRMIENVSRGTQKVN